MKGLPGTRSRFRVGPLLAAWGFWTCAAAAGGLAAAAAEPARSIPQLDAEFAAAVAHAVRRAEAIGSQELAAWARGWPLPAELDRQIVVAVPDDLAAPAFIDTAEERAIWEDLAAARRLRAAGLFEHAVSAARAHAAPLTRSERIAADAGKVAAYVRAFAGG